MAAQDRCLQQQFGVCRMGITRRAAAFRCAMSRRYEYDDLGRDGAGAARRERNARYGQRRKEGGYSAPHALAAECETLLVATTAAW
jgi:hypothetical protein